MTSTQPVQVDLDGLVNKIERIAAGTADNFSGLRALHELLLNVRDLLIKSSTDDLIASHPNPLNRFGRQCFSQSDEDGLTMEIVRRLGIEKGRFAEFGVGDGLENNTLILGALGWRGFWVGGESLAFSTDKMSRLTFTQARIDLSNIVSLTQAGVQALGAPLDVMSIDLDGNDIHLVQALLEAGVAPRLLIVEYNAKFPPPVRFEVAYNPGHVWQGDDYFGASLSSYVERLGPFGYRLVCTNAHTGSNAFFVRAEDAALFTDVPDDIETLYTPPRYHFYNRFCHKRSPKTVEAVLKD